MSEYDDDGPDERAYRRRRFRDPYGKSALGPGRQTEPCPTCGEPNRLTRADRQRGYQCDRCADAEEGKY